MRLNDALITNERYRGEPTTDAEGRTQWPVCILWDEEIQGFGVRIFPPVRGRASRKDFIVTWKIGLRNRTMSIGTFGVDCTLRQARKTAREAIDLARRGQDPIEARQRALGIGTPEDLASRFLFEHTAAARKKPGIPGGEVAPAPASEPDADGGSAATAAPEGSPSDIVVAEAAEPSDGVEEAIAALRGELPATEASSFLPTLAVEAATEPSAAELTEPADDAVPMAAMTEADEPAAPEEEMEPEAEPEPEPAFTPPPAARRAPIAPAAPMASRVAEPPRRPVAPPPPPPVKRGPTKVRLLPVPEALYKVLEHGARESEMTISAYLNALVEIARAAVGDGPVGRPKEGADGTPLDETGPSIRELFAQVQEAQSAVVGSSGRADRERDPD